MGCIGARKALKQSRDVTKRSLFCLFSRHERTPNHATDDKENVNMSSTSWMGEKWQIYSKSPKEPEQIHKGA